MPNAVADGLARRGFDVTTSRQAALISASDETQLAFANQEGRVLISRDQDFLRLAAATTDHAGIIFWSERQRTIGALIRAIDLLAVDHEPADVKGTVIYL